MGRVIMVQGTASNVGKSVLVTALCRIFLQDGYKVAPFKAQNMALNSFVTSEGGEIGRSQVVQAEAAGVEPTVYMNPVLLKPQADSTSQIIVLGKVDRTLEASQYYEYTPHLKEVVKDSLNKLRFENDIVVIEGAGSPAEINLKEREIVNMWVARMAGSPVLLVGDIDRGGVFASIVGTLELLTQEERDLIRGIIINRFRGNLELLKPALDFVEEKTGKPVLGVIPYFRDITIAQEDSVYLDERKNAAVGTYLDVVVIHLPRISNYDDFDPFEAYECIVRFVRSADEIGMPDLIIIPGTKSTIADLEFLKKQRLDEVIIHMAQKGTPVIGICGGYQMLGKRIHDPYTVESKETSVSGLGLLDIETTFAQAKTTNQVKARVTTNNGLLSGLHGMEITGYEIHMGQTKNQERQPVFKVLETPGGQVDYEDGSFSATGMIFGSYIHGLFHNNQFTETLLNNLRRHKGLPAVMAKAVDKEEQYDKLAELVRQNINLPLLYEIAVGKKND
ncbi:cobyric acid synthase [Chloroflexota bacterium]